MGYESGSNKMFYYIFGGLIVVVIGYFGYTMMTEEEAPVVPEADTLMVVEDTTEIAEEVPVQKKYTAPPKVEKVPEKTEEPKVPITIKETLPSRSAADLQLVLGQQTNVIQTCFAKARQKSPSLTGKLRYRITVDQSGSAEAIKVLTNETGSKTLESCISTKIKLMSFPKGKEKTTTEYTFSF